MDLDHKFEKASDVETFIDVAANSNFIVESVKNKKSQRKPSTPFITSTSYITPCLSSVIFIYALLSPPDILRTSPITRLIPELLNIIFVI